MIQASLNGWQRTWNATTDNAKSRTYCCPECLGFIESYIAVTNVVSKKGTVVHGACFSVNEDELIELQAREKRYDCLPMDVKHFQFPGFGPETSSIFVWSRKSQFCYQTCQQPFIPSDYLSSCLKGSLGLYGDQGADLFMRNTIKPKPFSVRPALRIPNTGMPCSC